MSADSVVPIRPLSEYKGVTMPKYGDGPIVFPNRDVLREYIAEQQASAMYEWANELDHPPYDLWDVTAIPRLRARADGLTADPRETKD